MTDAVPDLFPRPRIAARPRPRRPVRRTGARRGRSVAAGPGLRPGGRRLGRPAHPRRRRRPPLRRADRRAAAGRGRRAAGGPRPRLARPPGPGLPARRQPRSRAHPRDARSARRRARHVPLQPAAALRRAHLRLPRPRAACGATPRRSRPTTSAGSTPSAPPPASSWSATRTASATSPRGCATMPTGPGPSAPTASRSAAASGCRPACWRPPRRTPTSWSGSCASRWPRSPAGASTSGATRRSSWARARAAPGSSSEGATVVYAEHLRRIVEPLLADGCSVQHWGDIIAHDPSARGCCRPAT